MEKFLPLYSWDLNHVIQLYAYSLDDHVTTIQIQSIDFYTKNHKYELFLAFRISLNRYGS